MVGSPLTKRHTLQLAMLSPEKRMEKLRTMTPAEVLSYDAHFESWLHKGQRPPRKEGWRTWLMMAGRGYGKTRAGAEWITKLALQRAGGPVRIALVGATLAEVRAVMIEGESGLLAVAPKRRRPLWEPSRNQLTWPGGSKAFVYSAENPEGLRGPNHHFAWCDELAKWSHADATWDNLQLSLRLGERPRSLVTTTPRPVPILKRIGALTDAVTTRGRTNDNINLPDAFIAAMAATYGGTRLGRQELDGELIEDVEGALWTREMIERCRVILPACGEGDRRYGGGGGFAPGSDPPPPHFVRSPSPSRGGFARIVIGVDPPASVEGDACGIVSVGLGKDGLGYVLGDHSVRGLSPEGWARRVAAAAEAHGADCVIVEKNMGGNMVESVLRSADVTLPVRPAHARESKVARAEPVSILFASGKAKFAGTFPELEDELAGMQIGGGYQGPGRSPDRADAMVWAMSELMLGRKRGEPSVTFF